MTKILLKQIKIEYEHTQIGIEELCEKYNCTTKELRGYTKWEKNPEDSLNSCIRLVYDSLYVPQDATEWVVEPLYSPQLEDYIEKDTETIEAEIVMTAEDIKHNKPVDKSSIPIAARDGFEGLRLLDKKLQTQALTLLGSIDDMLHNVETAKDVRDLVASHTAIRDSYFNTKAPMVNILNGNVVTGNSNSLATLLEGVEDDC